MSINRRKTTDSSDIELETLNSNKPDEDIEETLEQMKKKQSSRLANRAISQISLTNPIEYFKSPRTCCLCIPIKTGIYLVALTSGLFGMALFVQQFLEMYAIEKPNFLSYFNFAVLLLFQAPELVANLFLLRWMLNDCYQTRVSLIRVFQFKTILYTFLCL